MDTKQYPKEDQMNRVFKFSTFAFALLFSALTLARPVEKKFVLHFDGQQFRQQGKIFLKQELQRQHGIRVSNFRLNRVKLVAKSRNGNGKAKLVVGQDQTQMKYINGSRRDFRYNGNDSWDKVNFRNPSYNSRGNWQIHLRGNIKVKRVVVFLERKRGPGPRPYPRPRPMPEPFYGKACFYQDAFFGGTSFCLESGQQKMSLYNFRNGMFNDEISSLKVFGGASVRVCTGENFGGRCKTFSQDQAQLGFTGDFWSIAINNRISSIEVY